MTDWGNMSVNIKFFADDIDAKSLEQCNTIANSPAFENAKIRIMPDVHTGKGCVVGFTSTVSGEDMKFIPNVVGVDIGCGMLTAKLGADSIDLVELDKIINEKIPAGNNVHSKIDEKAYTFIEDLLCREHLKNHDRLLKSLGTLGGGNHFIEVDKDEEGCLYLVIHSGSRNLGLQVANFYQDRAVTCQGMPYYFKEQEIIARLKREGREKEIQAELQKLREDKSNTIDKDLAYLDGRNAASYLTDAMMATYFARANRETMLRIIVEAMGINVVDKFHTIHNYVSSYDGEEECWFIRKGAVSAREGEKLLIPINMRDGALLCTGKGNPDWNYSAPHGAGRLMSRSVASKSISLEDFKESMEGIYSTSVCESTIDESPFAYKSADSIIKRIGETVTVDKILKPIYNFKAH